MIFDTHAHYDDRKFDDDREELLKQLRDAGIGRVVDIGAVSYTHLDVYKRQVFQCIV